MQFIIAFGLDHTPGPFTVNAVEADHSTLHDHLLIPTNKGPLPTKTTEDDLGGENKGPDQTKTPPFGPGAGFPPTKAPNGFSEFIDPILNPIIITKIIVKNN